MWRPNDCESSIGLLLLKELCCAHIYQVAFSCMIDNGILGL